MHEFNKLKTDYLVEIPEERFLALLGSESHQSDHAAFKDGNRTLSSKLEDLPGVSGVDYDGHFGAAVFVSIDTQNDTDEVKTQISAIIDAHLDWCMTLDQGGEYKPTLP